MEFAEHRQYVPGDDPRNLDWRVFGKSDRYYIKQYIEETNLRSVILVDASGSMQYTGRQAAAFDGRRLSKFEYAQYLAASLAHLMVHQQDAVGLVTFDTKVRRYIPSRSRVSHLRGAAGTERDGAGGRDGAGADFPRRRGADSPAGPGDRDLGPVRRPRGTPEVAAPLPVPEARGDPAARDGGGGTDVPVRPLEPVPRPGTAGAAGADGPDGGARGVPGASAGVHPTDRSGHRADGDRLRAADDAVRF